ncbi:ABC transporter permease [Streptomyces sp. RS10V-4]|uniref:ABC transporter permease n=1 Tax=Streptomyces rhizoryzae TaxID=2932493 RepID=UPI002003F04F|nr:ABC transporter permease [Streptomyces rhizoryzae]MCK7623426.1 ABC transporter permease [Streptomyces rhizoryzae]
MTADRRRPDHRSDHRGERRSARPGERRSARPGELRHVMTHLLTPLLMCIGMGLAYLGAFANPAPHHLPVAVVGTGTSAQVLAQTLNDRAHGDLEARTVPDRATAIGQLKKQEIFGAYVAGSGTPASGTAAAPGARTTGGTDTADRTTVTRGTHTTGRAATAPGAGARKTPELLVATAGSDTSATVAEKIFTPLAAHQGAPLKITDVAPTAKDDPTGQGIFFLMVAISIGSYASVAVIGGAGAVLPLRLRGALALGTSLVVGIIGTLFAGPVFHLVDHGLAGLWGMAWLYSAGILLIGTGLHTFLKRWTTLGVMALFVMLNFTSSGGIFRPEMQNGFFAALHSFWNGAGFVEGTRSHLYFDGHGLAGHVGTLVGWLLAGVLMLGAAGLAEKRRRTAEAEAVANAGAVAAAAVAATVPEHAPGRSGGQDSARADADRDVDVEEEMEEAVGV